MIDWNKNVFSTNDKFKLLEVITETLYLVESPDGIRKWQNNPLVNGGNSEGVIIDRKCVPVRVLLEKSNRETIWEEVFSRDGMSYFAIVKHDAIHFSNKKPRWKWY